MSDCSVLRYAKWATTVVYHALSVGPSDAA
jgi:hypothetical protein